MSRDAALARAAPRGTSIAQVQHQRQDDFARLIGIRGSDDSFLDALSEDASEQRCGVFEREGAQFEAEQRIVVPVEDLQQRKQQRPLCRLPQTERIKEPLESGERVHLGILHDEQEPLLQFLLSADQDRFQQRQFRVEVMIERAF